MTSRFVVSTPTLKNACGKDLTAVPQRIRMPEVERSDRRVVVPEVEFTTEGL
jgi:hypothetical protein